MRRSLILVTIAVLCALVPAVAGYDVVYTTPGEYTWEVPPGVDSIEVLLIGGGGGGGAGSDVFAGGGGGAGDVSTWHFGYDNMPNWRPTEPFAVMVGAGGTSGIYAPGSGFYGNGGFGGMSVFDYGYSYGGWSASTGGGINYPWDQAYGEPGHTGYIDWLPEVLATAGGGGAGGARGHGTGAGGGGGAKSLGPGYATTGGRGASGLVAITYHYPPPSIDWSPETGYYTGLWFDRHHDFIDVDGLFGSLMMPITLLIGSWAFMVVWGTICMGLYLYTQDTTLPFVVGILFGAVLSTVLGSDAITVMYITMAFAGAGVLAKVVLGRL